MRPSPPRPAKGHRPQRDSHGLFAQRARRVARCRGGQTSGPGHPPSVWYFVIIKIITMMMNVIININMDGINSTNSINNNVQHSHTAQWNNVSPN